MQPRRRFGISIKREIGTVQSTEGHTQKWYFEKWHEYQKKKDAIQRLYKDVIKWGIQRSGVQLLEGHNRIAVDVGSAHGYVVSLLNSLGYTACGCELSKFYVKTYAKKNAENFVVCDAQRLPFIKKGVDIITAFELVEHLPKYHQFFDQCYDSLKEGGALLMTTPNSTLRPMNLKFWRDYALGTLLLNNHNIDGHFHEFSSSSELKTKLGLQRFKRVIVETWWFAPVPPTLFDRYFVGQLPLFMIPHFRCIALK